ncbi:uncharacterized protein [Halyomorpha halys]|uniref:uncharacterized protein isoform X1 n=1 Tax=Halyomorpha halys TaxID=286706 RepID=UPI0006D4F9D9|nr:uncharacterized protein LOC106681740 isoform X1 [Halyomorpha halys]
MKTALLLIFTMHQMFHFSSALKCYECSGDCKEPKEKACDAAIKCCFSSVADPAGGAAHPPADAAAAPPPPPAHRVKRNIIHSDGETTRTPLFTAYLQDETAADNAAATSGGGRATGGIDVHHFKGCCFEALTKDICQEGLCYTCEKDLCNKGNTASASTILATILNLLLPLAIIGVAIGCPNKFFN